METALNSLLASSVLTPAAAPSFCLAFLSFSCLKCPWGHLESCGDLKLSWCCSWPSCTQPHPPPCPPGWAQPSVLCLHKDTRARVAFGEACGCAPKCQQSQEKRHIQNSTGDLKSRSGSFWSPGLLGSRVQVCAQSCHSQQTGGGLLLEVCLDHQSECGIHAGSGPSN